ncbi:hypothetical protein UA08_00259 [Talaromyces atroroseus]|uniref:Uncharacterized protein n=1 Tax=Talaromyces atroroseus TaxID=1441469 RepID=A0A225AZM4_TALAT|nr:hypothetical protein UA08_00259 [Talaromyces atroroseus]OKL63904.1 hypothetical protein UA08_00259 [Talaromyces atroroseus]
MSEEFQKSTGEHKEPFTKRLFEHHHYHDDQNQDDGTQQGGKKDNGWSTHEDKLEGYKKSLKKDEERLKNYYDEDKAMEEEGGTYGGLM